MAASMAAVAAKHWNYGLNADRDGWECECGDRIMGREGDLDEAQQAHLATALAAAGFGDVAQARDDALTPVRAALQRRDQGGSSWQFKAGVRAAVRSLRDEGGPPNDLLTEDDLRDEGDTAAGGDEQANVVQRIVNAWDCCGACAGGVLAAHVRERAASPGADALAEAVSALRELVALKDGPRNAEYERRKPLAWQRARAALAADPTASDDGQAPR